MPTDVPLPEFSRREWERKKQSKAVTVLALEHAESVKKLGSASLPFQAPTVIQAERAFRRLQKARPPWLDAPAVFPGVRSTGITKVLGITQLGSGSNAISGAFHDEQRWRCGGYNRLAPWTAWTGEGLSEEEHLRALTGLLAPLWRNVNVDHAITTKSYRWAFRLSSTTYVAAQFKVHVAAQVIERFGGGSILDFSAGWGDRLAGAFATDSVTRYIATDPNTDLFDGYSRQIETYNKWRTVPVQAQVFTTPAEDMEWSSHAPFDIVFTSPPYFSTERYAAGTLSEDHQSWSRYPDYESWRDGFLRPSLENAVSALRKGGTVLLNLPDARVERRLYPAARDASDTLKALGLHLEGVIGMRMKQRPLAWHDKTQKEEYMAAYSCEPIWVWRK